MRGAHGFLVVEDPAPRAGAPRRIERDTFRCNHCSKVVIVKPMCDPAELGGMCRTCGQLICSGCVSTNRCDPLEAQIERALHSEAVRRSYEA